MEESQSWKRMGKWPYNAVFWGWICNMLLVLTFYQNALSFKDTIHLRFKRAIHIEGDELVGLVCMLSFPPMGSLSSAGSHCSHRPPSPCSPSLTWIYECFYVQWKDVAELSGLVVLLLDPNGLWGVWVEKEEVGVDEGEPRSTMPNRPFSPGSRLSVWVRGALCHWGLGHSGTQCPCQSQQHFLPLLAPALAGIHNISQLPTMACLPAPTIWLLWATILTHITNYSKSWESRKPTGAKGEWKNNVGKCETMELCRLVHGLIQL